MKITALRDIHHGGVYHVAGDEFEVSETDGAYYIARRRKIMAVTVPVTALDEPLKEEPVMEAARLPSQPSSEEPVKPEEESTVEQGEKSDTPAERVKRKYVRRDQTLDGESRQYQRRDMTAEE